jgi:hypothetical protein
MDVPVPAWRADTDSHRDPSAFKGLFVHERASFLIRAHPAVPSLPAGLPAHLEATVPRLRARSAGVEFISTKLVEG